MSIVEFRPIAMAPTVPADDTILEVRNLVK